MGQVLPATRLVHGLPLLVWQATTPALTISSGPLGGGLGLRSWVLNATVAADYARRDPATHLGEIAEQLGLAGAGVGLLTAVDVHRAVTVENHGISVTATTGVGHPTWAAPQMAAQEVADLPYRPGTINAVAHCPVPLTEAALVNLVGTVTEAKTQAMLSYGVAGTGTATDTVTVLCPTAGTPESFGGTRSVWGARTAAAVYAAVRTGLVRDRASRWSR